MKWKKLLYLSQPYPDNYVPKSFLRDLRKNVNLEFYSLLTITLASWTLVQEISLVVIFLEAFYLLKFHNPQSIYLCVAILTSILYPLLVLLSNSIKDEIKTGFIFIISGFVVSPILKTLTETVSTDTIYTLVGLMLIVHLLFLDYGVNAAIVSTSLSINSAVFASVCLASRLSTSYQAFALLTLATNIFVVFPVVQRRLNSIVNDWTKFFIRLAFMITSYILLINLASLYIVILYSLLLLLISFYFPYRFYVWQFYKENIYGPWDEAILDKES